MNRIVIFWGVLFMSAADAGPAGRQSRPRRPWRSGGGPRKAFTQNQQEIQRRPGSAPWKSGPRRALKRRARTSPSMPSKPRSSCSRTIPFSTPAARRLQPRSRNNSTPRSWMARRQSRSDRGRGPHQKSHDRGAAVTEKTNHVFLILVKSSAERFARRPGSDDGEPALRFGPATAGRK